MAAKKTKKKATKKKAATKTKEQMAKKSNGKVDVITEIRNKFGKEAVMMLGDNRAVHRVPVFSTGSVGLDIATGIGGVPRGRIVEIYGPEASGKTTLTLHIVAEAQKAGGVCAFVDAEHALDTKYAGVLGVSTDKLMISQPDSGDQALGIVELMVRSGGVDLVVVDSVAALVPQVELDGEMGDATMGAHARLMSQAMRKLTAFVSKSNCTLIFVNQIRMKIGVMFGSPETTTGGNALKFYASMRLDIRRIAAVKDGEDIIGIQSRVRVIKNKLAPPFKEASFDIIYGKGISREGELINWGTDLGFVDKSGAWYAVDNERIGQGRRNAVATLCDQPWIAENIEDKIKKHFGVEKK